MSELTSQVQVASVADSLPAAEPGAAAPLASRSDRQDRTVCALLILSGLVGCLCGLAVLGQRHPFSALLLDALALFGVPWSQLSAFLISVSTLFGVPQSQAGNVEVALVSVYGLVTLLTSSVVIVVGTVIGLRARKRSATTG